MKLCGFDIGLDQRFFLIAGPCVVESEQLQMDVAGQLKEITSALGINFLFKSSFDKANRSSGASFRGPGMEKGLEILAKVRKEIGVPVLTDVSGPWPVIAVTDAVSKAAGRRISIESDFETLLAVAAQHDVEIGPGMGPGAVLESLYEELVEPHTVFPTFYCDFPEETSPLTAPHRSERGLVERWDLVVNGLDCSGVPIDQALSLADARGDAGVCGVSCRGGGHLKAS